ncbi:hypothetical protein LY90DRAFT_510951 [Neocallimastix californiae]|uniref:Uncharacterized protein n=1 Tax=Neocallimastix californiae TaxID=1754190 RepID=A0A1Y2BU69_9FUNG|nr:hypothetical protein LY90DRAFT_510951 [Neocallimastix californiae]|eukprot:ORY38296.1 hypothetical protein LY90DRAFT_510951 [Neocallimastix californiae]
MVFICPEYNPIKSKISRNLNKKLPSNVTTFAEIPNEFEYYKTKRGENFMIFKNFNLIIFQSLFHTILFKEYNDDIFVDEYFYKTYLVSYDMKIWNYYNNMEHITSNASESLNNYLNNLFPTKLSYYELIDKLNELEHLSYYDYQRKIRGIWKIKKKKEQ